MLIAATALVEGKLGKSLKKVLKKIVAKEAHEQLAISDVKLGGVIKVSDTIIFILYTLPTRIIPLTGPVFFRKS